jgi:FKBP-type peptidyl-prolyl cis-trans isomerase FklB
MRQLLALGVAAAFALIVASVSPALLAQAGAQSAKPAPPPASQPSTPPASQSATQPAGSPAQPAPATPAQPAGPAPTTQKEKLSYALGINLARQFQSQAVDVDVAFFTQGLRDTLTGGKPALTEEEVRAVMTAFQEEMKTKQAALMKRESEKNAKEATEFLAANKDKEGVVTLPSGLQYKVLKEGTGPKPTLEDTVVCHYRGTLINGIEFDSSYKRNEPAKFPVKGVIKGWTEALQLMPVGSKYQLFVPSSLAYGDRGAGPVIGPNALLIFEVELVSIQPKQ